MQRGRDKSRERIDILLKLCDCAFGTFSRGYCAVHLTVEESLQKPDRVAAF